MTIYMITSAPDAYMDLVVDEGYGYFTTVEAVEAKLSELRDSERAQHDKLHEAAVEEWEKRTQQREAGIAANKYLTDVGLPTVPVVIARRRPLHEKWNEKRSRYGYVSVPCAEPDEV